MNAKRGGSPDSDDERAKKKTRARTNNLETDLAKYEQSRGLKAKKAGKNRRDESDVLDRMNAFRGKLKGMSGLSRDDDASVPAGEGGTDAADAVGDVLAPLEVDDDVGFLSHNLKFAKDAVIEEAQRAERDYEVIDPRKRSARAKEEERERRQKRRLPDGGRGAAGRRF